MAPHDLEALITSLEKETKALLFNRREELWTLTMQGQFLFRKARIVLSEIELVRSVLEEKDAISGNLRIITTYSLTSLWIGKYIPGFLSQYPDIRLSIYPHDREVDVSLGEGDVAIRPLIPDGQNIIQHYLMTWHVGLYASPAYIEKFGHPKSLDDLDKHRLITLGHENIKPYKDVNWILTYGRRPDEMPREPYLRINALQPVIDSTIGGLGISSLAEELPIVKQGRLVRILPEVRGPEVDIFFICPQILANSKKILALKDYLTEKVRQESETKEIVRIH